MGAPSQPTLPRQQTRTDLRDLVKRYHGNPNISDEVFEAICDGAVAIAQSGATRDDLYNIVNVRHKMKSTKPGL